MGTGKTVVGRELARLLGREFADLDAAIETEAGRTVAEIFADEGEAGFRCRERAAVAGLATPAGRVLATGGGVAAGCRPTGRPSRRAATLVLLTAASDELAGRLAGDAGRRPLLAGRRPTCAARIAELLAARADTYAGCDHEVDTTGLDPGRGGRHAGRPPGRRALSPNSRSACPAPPATCWPRVG